MSDTDKRSITGALAAATCTLLGANAGQPVQAQEDPGWDFNTALLYYGEDDDRVQDLSVSLLARRTFVDDRVLSLGMTADVLTGASPSGALPQGFPQTFTRPSGNDAYGIDANLLPLDDTFRDTRVALTADWQQPLGRLYQVNVGASASREYDYTHFGINGKIARDFKQRNTTLSAGVALARDRLDPVGETPIGLTPMLNVGDLSNRTGAEDKTILDVVFGVTQIISRDLLVQMNYSYSDSSGYLSDPYKLLSVVDGVSGETIAVAQTPGVGGPSHLYLHEHRPEDRAKHSLYTQAKYYMGGKVLDVSYRYMTDDWEIDSHTIDLRYRWPLADKRYIEPHLRFYSQTEAEFYRLSLTDGDPLPAYASADYRLGDFDALTVGAKYGWTTDSGNPMSVRLEFYQQSGNVAAEQLIGSQVNQDNYPDLSAIILQFGYQFGN
ncbi:MAG: DUF3570 domain-containing protein [Gammaproteobacteria bacterium]|nr:DUF3570 domain-containing protein [Gammaproteobacteria bacterium]